MDKVRQLVTQHQDKYKFLLFTGAGIGAFNTLARPDYNMILFLYIYYVWNNMNDSKEVQTSEKINSFFVLTYSLLIDFIWCFFWGSRWGSKTDYESTIHFMVIFFSWIGILVKIVSLVFIGVIEWANIRSSLPAKLQEKLNAGGNYQAQNDEVNA